MKPAIFLTLAMLAASAVLATSALAERRCFRSYWVWMGQERVKVCCASGVCTTKYGLFQG